MDNSKQKAADTYYKEVGATEYLGNSSMFEPGETVLPQEYEQAVGSSLGSGDTFAKDYYVLNELDKAGAQSRIYLVRRDGRDLVLKLYSSGFSMPADILGALSSHNCPNVVKLLDYGEYDSRYYEIYRYFSRGTLNEMGKCSFPFIKDIVVPQMNEGLHFLHTLNGTGLIHGDIKPANIFLGDDEKNVIIGDFGISAYMDGNGKLIDSIKGTPEYSPRTKTFFGLSAKTPAYDYASLGLVLIRLATGYSIFEGLSKEGIAKKWDEGLELPDSIEPRLVQLINGLITEDEEARFGYTEVKEWCQGDLIREVSNINPGGHRRKQNNVDAMIFAIVQGRVITVASLRELCYAMAQNWEFGVQKLDTEVLSDFLRQVYADDMQSLDALKKICESNLSPNVKLFRFIYTAFPIDEIYYKSRNFGLPAQFFELLEKDCDNDMVELIQSGLLEFYLRCHGYDENLCQELHRLSSMTEINGRILGGALHYMLSADKTFGENGVVLSSINELIDLAVDADKQTIHQLANNERLQAWLFSIGYEKEIAWLSRIETGE